MGDTGVVRAGRKYTRNRRFVAPVLVSGRVCRQTSRSFSSLTRTTMKQERGTVDPIQMTTLLRASVFTLNSADVVGTTGDASAQFADQPVDQQINPVWGVMIEFGHPQVITSLVALQDGSVSVYMSDGSGVIGCGLHPEVRSAARKMLALAQDAEHQCIPMTQFPSPAEDSVTVYLLTQKGVMGTTVMRNDLDEGAVELAELYYAAHGVIGIVELLGAGVDLVDEMRLTRAQLDAAATSSDAEALIAQRESKHELPRRGRACRILPYVGNVARRSNS